MEETNKKLWNLSFTLLNHRKHQGLVINFIKVLSVSFHYMFEKLVCKLSNELQIVNSKENSALLRLFFDVVIFLVSCIKLFIYL